MIIRTVAEIFVVLALIFGFLKENKIVRIERRAWRFLRRLRRKAHEAREQELERELLDARYADEYEPRRRSKPAKASSAGEKKRKSARDRVA
jgi:Sec-independent protein translocase protein TatA